MSLSLVTAAFTPITTLPDQTEVSVALQVSSIAELLGQQTQQVTDAAGLSNSESLRHFLCSTMLELPFTSGDIQLQDLQAPGQKHLVSSYINTYECASWGYSLRYYLQQMAAAGQQQGYLLFSILDANVLRLSFWRENENWGHSGFGLTTVVLYCNDVEQAQQQLTTGCAQTWNSTPEFATLIRRYVSQRQNITLSLPFFPENIRQIFDKLLQQQPKLADRHKRWGHVFGSDPWLNLIEHQCATSAASEGLYMPASIALNGYYCWVEVRLTDTSQCWLNPVWRWPQEVLAC